jgi:hypothetical protein
MNLDNFETSDFALITFLSLKFKPLSLYTGEKSRVYFIFENSEGLQTEVSNFYNKNTCVDVLTFWQQSLLIRRQIKNQQYINNLT